MQYNFLKISSKHSELTDTSTDQHTSSKEKLANGWCSTHEHNIYRFSKKNEHNIYHPTAIFL
jgi:hypothetical protein